ncbi:MAG: hypothetical protein ACP5I8_06870 [Phycisphaerae bacterium]
MSRPVNFYPTHVSNARQNAGHDTEVATLLLSYVPRAITARDTRGLIKQISDKKTDLLPDARILAPEGAELLMELAMAIKFGIQTVERTHAKNHPQQPTGRRLLGVFHWKYALATIHI